VTVVGPSSAVSAGIVDDLVAVVGADHVVRAGGADRYAVAARVHALAWPDLPRGFGFGFEPWHVRFVGTPLARAYHEGGWHTLEAFLDEPPAPLLTARAHRAL